MARKKSELLSTFGIAFRIFMALVNEVLKQGGSDEDIRRIETDAEVRRRIAELLIGNNVQNDNLFPIRIDFSKTLEQRIADGRYDRKNSDINSKYFSSPQIAISVELTTELIHFKRYVSSDDALAELDRMGYRPATLDELLAFGEKYPYKQREFPIVALGSVWRSVGGYRLVAGLYGDRDERRLSLLGNFGDGWAEDSRFLAVRK